MDDGNRFRAIVAGYAEPPLEVGAIERIVLIAYLAISADAHLAEEERAGFRHVLVALAEHSGGVMKTDPDELLEKLGEPPARDAAERALRRAAGELGRQSDRELAYAIACALAFSDGDDADQEFEFDLTLIDALGLDAMRSEAISADVRSGFAS